MTLPTDTAPTRLQETRRALDVRSRSIRLDDISKATGVSVAWLSRLQNGKMQDASSNKIDAVRAYLESNK